MTKNNDPRSIDKQVVRVSDIVYPEEKKGKFIPEVQSKLRAKNIKVPEASLQGIRNKILELG